MSTVGLGAVGRQVVMASVIWLTGNPARLWIAWTGALAVTTFIVNPQLAANGTPGQSREWTVWALVEIGLALGALGATGGMLLTGGRWVAVPSVLGIGTATIAVAFNVFDVNELSTCNRALATAGYCPGTGMATAVVSAVSIAVLGPSAVIGTGAARVGRLLRRRKL